MSKTKPQPLSSARSLDERVEEWGLVRRGAAKMLFVAGESYDSISRIMGVSADQLKAQIPNPPQAASLEEYDALQVLAIFRGDYVLTDHELIRDLYDPDERLRIKTKAYNNGVRTILRDDLRNYLRKKALRSLGFRDEEIKYIP